MLLGDGGDPWKWKWRISSIQGLANHNYQACEYMYVYKGYGGEKWFLQNICDFNKLPPFYSMHLQTNVYINWMSNHNIQVQT